MDDLNLENEHPTAEQPAFTGQLINLATAPYQPINQPALTNQTTPYQSTNQPAFTNQPAPYQSPNQPAFTNQPAPYQSTNQPAFTNQPASYQSTNQPASTNQLITYTLHLADNALILGHRNSEWCGHGPVLELDIAITNIALDLIGQARYFYQYAAELMNDEAGLRYADATASMVTEDTLAYLRGPHDFKNCLLVEQPNGHWGVTVLRQFLFSVYQYHLYGQLQNSDNVQIASIAARALKEVTYHVRWSSDWVIRLGTGTEESHGKMVDAANTLMEFTQELFAPAPYEKDAALSPTMANLPQLQPLWQLGVEEVFKKANLPKPPFFSTPTHPAGKEGNHTNHLSQILDEMQQLPRTYGGAFW